MLHVNILIKDFPFQIIFIDNLDKSKKNIKENIARLDPQQVRMKMICRFFNYNLASSFHDSVKTFIDTMFTIIRNDCILKL